MPAETARQTTFMVPLESAVIHNQAQVEQGAMLSISTPSARWAYAAEFPIPSNAANSPSGPRRIRVNGLVRKGSIGVGCLGDDGQFVAEVDVARHNQTSPVPIDLIVGEGKRVCSIIVRNTSTSSSHIEIAGIEVFASGAAEEAAGDALMEAAPEVVIDASSLGYFIPWAGHTPGGYWTDFLGVRTRTDVWAFTPEAMEIYSHDRTESPGLPTDREHLLDWMPLLDAVVRSGSTFVMVALGAGWGRWLSAGAFAARQSGRDYRLVGVEAEPTHFEWMQRHFAENGIEPDRCTLIRAAASNREGACWFRTGDPAAWYGQSIVPEADLDPTLASVTPLWSDVTVGDTTLQRSRCVDLRAVARDIPLIDYMHMDIQGAEADFLEAYPDLLQQRVRAVNVGTHSKEIEDRLRALFSNLGWRCAYDVPLHSSVMVRLGASEAQRIEFGDGVQFWINDRVAVSGRI